VPTQIALFRHPEPTSQAAEGSGSATLSGYDFSRADKASIFIIPRRASAREESGFLCFPGPFNRHGVPLRYLMVTTYPPAHCGIAAYAAQSVAQLRAQGHTVAIVSPDGAGDVDFPCDLRGGSKILKLRKLLPDYDAVILQYQWEFFYANPLAPEYRWDTLKTHLAFIRLYLSSPKIQVVAHELPCFTGAMRWLYRLQWKLAPKIVFHTARERERFEQHYRMKLSDSRVEFRKHDDVYRKFADHSQATARQRLGLPPERMIFLCIGFIQRHKGFHRAMQAFARANLRDAEIYVVGSLRVSDDESQAYLAELKELAAGRSQIHLIESFVSNEDFDTWISASDIVVLPYSEIWSSAVLGRVHLLERFAIVSAVGGLPDQAGERDLLFANDEELVSAFQAVARDHLPATRPSTRR
jgi:glycosyltransferase involved in cell wall biosynthesis